MNRTLLVSLFGVLALAPTAVHADLTEVDTPSVRGTPAWFDGRWIDMSVDWEGATACAVQASGNVCFRDEAAMDAALDSSPDTAPLAATSTCASALRLYDGTSYTGTVLTLYNRLVTINLSTYGFDNVTSSYKVGACDVDMYSGANLGGSTYPGDTTAGAQAATLVFGWSNTISSVYIN